MDEVGDEARDDDGECIGDTAVEPFAPSAASASAAEPADCSGACEARGGCGGEGGGGNGSEKTAAASADGDARRPQLMSIPLQYSQRRTIA